MVIKWFPYDVPVVSTKMPNDEFGEFKYYPSPRILVSDSLQGVSLTSTIFHEILEMVNEMNDLGLTENQIRTLEVCVTQILCQNPGLPESLFPCPIRPSKPEGVSEDPQVTGTDPEPS